MIFYEKAMLLIRKENSENLISFLPKDCKYEIIKIISSIDDMTFLGSYAEYKDDEAKDFVALENKKSDAKVDEMRKKFTTDNFLSNIKAVVEEQKKLKELYSEYDINTKEYLSYAKFEKDHKDEIMCAAFDRGVSDVFVATEESVKTFSKDETLTLEERKEFINYALDMYALRTRFYNKSNYNDASKEFTLVLKALKEFYKKFDEVFLAPEVSITCPALEGKMIEKNFEEFTLKDYLSLQKDSYFRICR